MLWQEAKRIIQERGWRLEKHIWSVSYLYDWIIHRNGKISIAGRTIVEAVETALQWPYEDR